MRVLINALGATMGGALRHLTNFLPALDEAPGGHRYDVLVRSSIPATACGDRIRLIRWQDRHAQSSVHRTLADLAGSAVRARHYDVLVSLMNFGPILCPIPHVLFQRNALYFSRDYRRALDPLPRLELAFRRRWTVEAMRFAEMVVTPSRAMREMILKDCPGLARAKFNTLYHGFEAETLGDRAGAQRTLPGFPKLLYTAHLGRYKNFEVLLRALALLKSSYPEIQLFLTFDRADHAADFAHYENMASKLGVTAQVTFTGRIAQNQVGSLYRASDVFVFPSFCESFGFPLLEAMGSGVPIAASDIPVNREICQGAALYFDTKDAQACASCIRTIIEDRGRAQSLRERGARVLGSFDWSWGRYAREFVGLIEKAAMCRAARRRIA